MIKNSFFDKKFFSLLGVTAVLGISILLFGPAETLDKKLYYTGAEARLLLDLMGPQLRSIYQLTEILDLCFTLSYSVFYFQCFSKLFGANSLIRFSGLVTGILDLLETGTILFILRSESNYQILDWLGSVTLMKWISTLIIVSVFILGFTKKGGIKK
jgi:hypothetical protein